MIPKPCTALIAVLAALIYLALAAAGLGGVAPFLTRPPLVALAVATLALTLVSLFSGGNLSPGRREDRGNRWVIAAFGLIGVIDGYLPALTDRVGFWTVDGEAVRWLGVALYVAGGVLRIRPVFVLGRRFSGLVAIQPGHELVTTGLYGTIRNPSYLGLLINAVGWALAFRALAGVLLAALLIPPLVARMHAEERLLLSEFGETYAVYRRRTWRLVPWIY